MRNTAKAESLRRSIEEQNLDIDIITLDVTDITSIQTAINTIFEKYFAGNQKRANESQEQVYQTGLEVAQVLLNVATNENPSLRIRTSKWAEDFCQYKTEADPDGTKLLNEIKSSFV